MLHTWDPFAIRLWGDFAIRWYGLSYLAGFFCAYLLIRYFSRKGLSQIPSHLVSDFVFTVAIGTVIGGRLGYCIFYSPELLTRFNASFPFWGVLAVNEGGMASHGGIAGIVIAALLFARRHGFDALHGMDLCALTGPIGIFFGRIANFINGELVGRPCEQAFNWCVKFPQDILSWPSSEVAKLKSLAPAVSELGIDGITWNGWLQTMFRDRGAWGSVERALYSILDAVQAGNSPVSMALEPLLTLRHPSQLYEGLLEGLLLFIVLFLVWAKPRKPGVVTGWFFCIYSLVRIVGEQFRMPDSHIGFQALGLTRGQWLSIVMLALGAAFLLFVFGRQVKKYGGWANQGSNFAGES